MDSAVFRILIVEDHEDTREFLGVLLAMSKYEVETASTFFEGLRLAYAHAFDLFIFDSMLPDGSGVELCRLVRGFNQRTPIIFCSGLAYETDITKALGAGAQAYLVKPIDTTDLIQSVQKLIGQSSGSQLLEKRAV